MCGAQEERWECLKVSTHQKDVRIINIYTPHKKVTKWMKQILIKNERSRQFNNTRKFKGSKIDKKQLQSKSTEAQKPWGGLSNTLSDPMSVTDQSSSLTNVNGRVRGPQYKHCHTHREQYPEYTRQASNESQQI